jgi:chromate transport protein ChrA
MTVADTNQAKEEESQPHRLGPTTVEETTEPQMSADAHNDEEPRVVPADRQFQMSWKMGFAIILGFAASLALVLGLRGGLHQPPLLFSLFSNMYLAGTIIFGGGIVVIPLLREYVVQPGWVSPRDFLLGVAMIQSWPGPNFNIAVCRGTLTALNGGYNPVLGAVCGFFGILLPGIVTVTGQLVIWNAIRGWRSVKSALRGLNAAAIGLIYTAVYRIRQIGWIDAGFSQGTSLANDPWWVVITATTYVGGTWFGLSPPVAILLGAVMGLIRYGVISAE